MNVIDYWTAAMMALPKELRLSFGEPNIMPIEANEWGLFQKWPHLSLQIVNSVSLKSLHLANFKAFDMLLIASGPVFILHTENKSRLL